MARYVVVRINGSDGDTFAAASLGEALESAQRDPGDKVQVCVVQASDAGAARLMGKGWATLSERHLGPIKNMSTTTIRDLFAIDGHPEITYAQAAQLRDTTPGDEGWA